LKNIKRIKHHAKQFLSAVDLNEVPQAIEQLGAVASLMQKDRSFKNAMISPAFGPDEVGHVISWLSEKLGMSGKTSKYLRYLVESGAAISLSEIVASIQAGYLEMRKRSRAVVTTPIQVGNDYEAQLSAALKTVTGRDIDIDFVVDPSILGGVSIKVGSTLYDSSVKGQLRLLKDKLIKG
jgi:F-type H+-transporting ATPase subunit delta